MKKLAFIPFMFFAFNITKDFSQPIQNNFALARNVIYDSIIQYENNIHTSSYFIKELINKKRPAKAILGYTSQNRPLEAYYFPGTSDKKALVIGGMHGSELPSIEIAKKLIGFLTNGKMLPYYNVIIIPSLFADNAAKAAMVAEKSTTNFGRYTTIESVDPNRQMPALGKAFNTNNPIDMYGRIIEKENQLLLQLIQDYQPERIVNLHAIKDTRRCGIYADPRTDCHGYALGFEKDSNLAVSMATFIEKNGGDVTGNDLQKNATALYYNDPEIAGAGSLQKRNFHGSFLQGNRGFGVSLGGWATTAVCDGAGQREASILITVEFPGYKPSAGYKGKEKEHCIQNIELYALSVLNIFLEDNNAEVSPNFV
jgi:hypothetical protein